jgi:Zn-dependent metalloprotease
LVAAGVALATKPLILLPASERAGLQVLLPQRAEALRFDLASRARLGSECGLREIDRQVDAYGETHVRFQQTHRGLPVWGAFALAHCDAQGRIQEPHLALQTIDALQAALLLGPERAIQEALDELALSFQAIPLVAPQAELVVFPTRCVGGFAYLPGPEPGLFRMDPSLSVVADLPQDPYVQAYEVRTRHLDPVRGIVARDFIVDGRTGQILRKEEGHHHQMDPVKALGYSQYSGTVVLDAMTRSDNRVELRDTTRPKVAHPRQNSLLGPGEAPSNIVFATLTTSAQSASQPYGNSTAAFGDGLTFNFLLPYGPELLFGANGQTAAVDVAYGLQVGWDLLKNVAKRDGPDGKGGALVAEVHSNLSFLNPYANAYWDPATKTLAFGDGGSGYFPLTSVDVVVHEFGHALTSATADLRYSGESGGLNEAASDILGTAGEAYARAGGSGESLAEPSAGANWLIGEQVYPGPAGGRSGIRSLQKPSLYGYTPEGWFDGMSIYDVHTTSGIGNRCFYFLSEGSSPSDPLTSSEFLPRGMTGIGIHKAFQIWFRALTTKIADPLTDYTGMRVATEAAAVDLHGAGSAEWAAVQDAWAAVNVGPSHGQTLAPRLRFDPGPWPGGVVQSSYSSNSRDLFVGLGGTVALPKVLLEGFATPPALTWQSFFPVNTVAGTVRISPLNAVGWNTSLTVQGDGTPYKAMTMINPVSLDMDGDGESDAQDAALLGIFAMTGKLPTEPWSPATTLQLYPPLMLIYRWNRAFQTLAEP